MSMTVHNGAMWRLYESLKYGDSSGISWRWDNLWLGEAGLLAARLRALLCIRGLLDVFQ